MSNPDQASHIKRYWDNQARTHGRSHWASWGDTHMVKLEIDAIGEHISTGSSVLDVGCANGYSTFSQYQRHSHCSFTGVDFSEPMIEEAQRVRELDFSNAPIQFSHADVRTLPFEADKFDLVYTTRVLINLPTWEEQKQGIRECIRVTKAGGKVVLSEGFWEPLARLNAMRLLVALPPLVEHDFNRYIKQQALEAFLEENGISYEVNDFSSVYYLGSRFLRELVTNPSEYPGYSNPINELFYRIEQEYSGGGFGVQQIYILSK